MAQVKFYRGLKANYSEASHIDGLYFATDTKEVILNNVSYGGADLGLAENKVVKSIATNPTIPTQIDVVYTDSSTGTITIPTAEYISSIVDKNLTTPNAVGGINAGVKVSELEGKTQSQMWDELLFPTVKPTYVLPTSSIAWSSFSTLVEAGSTGPLVSNFTTGYNPGAIMLNGAKQNNRGGALDADNSFIYVGTADNRSLPATIALGNTTFRYRAAYLAGPQPMDNKGNNVDTSLAAGTVDSNTITVNGTYPWYATTTNNTTLTKQALISWNNTPGGMTTPKFVVQPVGSGKQEIKLPRTITAMQQENPISGNMDAVSFTNWTHTEVQELVNGINVTYHVYTYAGSSRSNVTLIVKF